MKIILKKISYNDRIVYNNNLLLWYDIKGKYPKYFRNKEEGIKYLEYLEYLKEIKDNK